MKRLVSMLTAAAMIAALGTGAFAGEKMKKGASDNASAMGQSMSTKCAPGKKYVKGYKKKDGTKVKGYCR